MLGCVTQSHEMVLNEGKTLKLLSGKFSFLVNVFFSRQVANCMENNFFKLLARYARDINGRSPNPFTWR